MMNLKKMSIKSGQNIRQKLEDLLENISNEVLNYQQEKVHANIEEYIQMLAANLGVLPQQLEINISWQGYKVEAYNLSKEMIITELTLEQFIQIFAGTKMPTLPSTQDKIDQKVKTYLELLSVQHQIERKELFIKLRDQQGRIVIKLYHKEGFLQKLSIGGLIKHFR